MKLTNCVDYINLALNYPALAYNDLSLFFDMAIAELNTTLHTNIPTVTKMIEEFGRKVSKPDFDKIILTSDPSDDNFAIPTDPADPASESIQVYYSSTDKQYYVLNSISNEYTAHKLLKAIYIDELGNHYYQAINYGSNAAWAEVPADPIYECELEYYLPDEWVLLWLIPYVCFKYTCKDGGTAQTFADELTQGFQQLQESYDIPSKVLLATYADRPAYSELVEKYLPNLNVEVRTRAIYPAMKHSRNTNAIFGSMYDRGGF